MEFINKFPVIDWPADIEKMININEEDFVDRCEEGSSQRPGPRRCVCVRAAARWAVLEVATVVVRDATSSKRMGGRLHGEA